MLYVEPQPKLYNRIVRLFSYYYAPTRDIIDIFFNNNDHARAL